MKDYDIWDCFNEIDIYSSGFLTKDSLREFLSRFNLLQDEEILKFIIKSFTEEESISITHFISFTDLLTNPESYLITSQDPRLFEKVEKGNMKRFEEALQVSSEIGGQTSRSGNSRLHYKPNYNIGCKIITANIQQDNQRADPPNLKTQKREKKYFERKQKLKTRIVKDYKKDSRKLRLHHKNQAPSLVFQMVKTIQKIIEIEKDNENFKQSLVLRPDFDIAQFFAFFDNGCLGSISPLEFKSGLEELGVIPHKEDLYLIMKNYNRDVLGRLNLEDFIRMFCPHEKEYKKLIQEKMRKTSNFKSFIVVSFFLHTFIYFISY